jgi:hypothetical protein
MAERKSGRTLPGLDTRAKGAIDVAEGRKGTAAADPVLVVTPEGEIVGTRLDGRRPAAEPVEVELKDTRSPAEIEADIDRTRERLSATLDELSDRLTPRELARRGGQRIKAQFVEPETGKVRRGPVAAAVGGLGLTISGLVAVAMWKARGRAS